MFWQVNIKTIKPSHVALKATVERLSTKNEFAERAAWTLWGLVRVCVWMVNMRLSCEQLVTYGFCLWDVFKTCMCADVTAQM